MRKNFIREYLPEIGKSCATMVNSWELERNCFVYKNAKKKYVLTDLLTGLEMHKFDKLKDCKKDFEFWCDKRDLLIEKQREYYNKMVYEFEELLQEVLL